MRVSAQVVYRLCRGRKLGHVRVGAGRGAPGGLHVHDEVVVEADAGRAEEVLARLVTVLSTPPPWAAGFPVEVEGFVSERYFKSPPPGSLVLRARNGHMLS
jgi:hypothetical protein